MRGDMHDAPVFDGLQVAGVVGPQRLHGLLGDGCFFTPPHGQVLRRLVRKQPVDGLQQPAAHP